MKSLLNSLTRMFKSAPAHPDRRARLGADLMEGRCAPAVLMAAQFVGTAHYAVYACHQVADSGINDQRLHTERVPLVLGTPSAPLLSATA